MRGQESQILHHHCPLHYHHTGECIKSAVRDIELAEVVLIGLPSLQGKALRFFSKKPPVLLLISEDTDTDSKERRHDYHPHILGPTL